MNVLYRRLKSIGFDPTFVRAHVLPDWWTDALADDPSTRLQAELAISRMLRIPLKQLHAVETDLVLPKLAGVRLKKDKDIVASDLTCSIILTQQVSAAIVPELIDVPRFKGKVSAAAVREEILGAFPYVDLDSLLWYAWRHGIAVLHLAALPRGKKFSGLAQFCGPTPAIVLASGFRSPPWLAFHLAHELGHILLGHVTPESGALVDSDVDKLSNDEDERAADRFACEILTGKAEPAFSPTYGLTGPKLADAAKEYGKKNRVDAGVVALIYGRSAQRMPAAQNALKLLNLNSGAHERIAHWLDIHLPPAHELPEFAGRCLDLVSTVD